MNSKVKVAAFGLAAVLAAVASTGPTSAARPIVVARGTPHATLCDRPNMGGRCVEVAGEVVTLDSYYFNNRTRSARFQGQWLVCETAGFRGECRVMAGEVQDFEKEGLTRVSSLHPVAPPRRVVRRPRR